LKQKPEVKGLRGGERISRLVWLGIKISFQVERENKEQLFCK